MCGADVAWKLCYYVLFYFTYVLLRESDYRLGRLIVGRHLSVVMWLLFRLRVFKFGILQYLITYMDYILFPSQLQYTYLTNPIHTQNEGLDPQKLYPRQHPRNALLHIVFYHLHTNILKLISSTFSATLTMLLLPSCSSNPHSRYLPSATI